MSSLKILLAHAKPSTAEEVLPVLSNIGYALSGITADPDHFLVETRRLSPDVILMDMAFHHRLEEEGKTPLGFPVVYITDEPAHTSSDHLDEIVGPLSYVQLPLRENDLHLAIQIVLLRRRVDHDLAQSEKHYRQLVDLAQEGVCRVDAFGVLTFVNARMSAILSYSSDELIGKPLVSFLDESGTFAQRRRSTMQQMSLFPALDNREKETKKEEQAKLLSTERHECEFLRKDGKRIIASMMTAHLTDAFGDYTGSLVLVTDITGQRHAETELKRYAHRVIEVQEEERKRVARELHDGVNQILTGVKFRLHAAAKRAGPELGEDISKAHDLIDQAIGEIRAISRNLRPGMVDDFGLIPALTRLCEEFQSRSEIVLTFDPPEDMTGGLGVDADLAIYRVVQEAFANIEKHAQATTARLAIGRQGEITRIEIADNGRGVPPSVIENRSRPGLGLAHIEERVGSVGGRVTFQNTNPGFKIVIELLHKR